MSKQPVIVVGRFPPPLDGQSIATRRLAQLLESDIDVRRVDLSTGEREQAESKVRLRRGRVRHYLATRRWIRRAVEAENDPVVLWPAISASTLGHFRDVFVTFPALKQAERVVAVVHWGNFDQIFRKNTTRRSANHLIKRLSAVVFLNQILRERCTDFVPDEKAFTVPNTVEESVLVDEKELDRSRTLREDMEPFRLLYVGSMTTSKGWMHAVKAVELLQRQAVDVRFDLVGRWESDTDRIAFDDEVTRHGLTPKVVHHGALSDRNAIKSMYSRAHAFVLPTFYPTEAQPLTIIEALNAGTPVIATHHAGIPEMMNDGTEGFFVPPRDPDAIADAVNRMMERDRWRRLSSQARKRFNDSFHPNVVRSQWLDLIKKPETA